MEINILREWKGEFEPQIMNERSNPPAMLGRME